MKIALLGLGQMGKLIKELALERGHSIISLDPNNKSADFDSITALNAQDFDLAIEFSHPSSAYTNIKSILELGKPIVVGTTGWYDKLDEIKNVVVTTKKSLIYATNFSIGVYLFNEIVKEAGKLINNFTNYDVAGIEIHHNRKADSPSGTARTLAQTLLSNINRKEKVIFDCVDRKIEANELQFVSQRIGSVTGTHQINFDSSEDSITLTHTAKNRVGFALGAILAGEWLVGKTGFFTIEDFFKSRGC